MSMSNNSITLGNLFYLIKSHFCYLKVEDGFIVFPVMLWGLNELMFVKPKEWLE